MSRARPRIYVDYNGAFAAPSDPDRIAVRLTTAGSIRDLANAGIVLQEGTHLIGCEESDEVEDLEGHGIVRYDASSGGWLLELDEAGIRDVPARDRTPVTLIACVTCGEDVADRLASVVDVLRGACPSCGAPLNAPIRPPA